LKYSITEILIKTTTIPNVMIDSYNYHKKIFDSIKSKNNGEAVNNIKEHLDFVKRNFAVITMEEKS